MKQTSASPADPLEVWRTLSSAWKRLYRAAATHLAPTGLSLPDFSILRILVESGDSPMVKLSNDLLLTPPTITGTIDRLETRGLVHRVRDTTDRRVITIRVTPKGRETFRKALKIQEEFIKGMISRVGEEELLKVGQILTRMGEDAGS
jgi:DNA-binding MarR family transcriptional regulator